MGSSPTPATIFNGSCDRHGNVPDCDSGLCEFDPRRLPQVLLRRGEVVNTSGFDPEIRRFDPYRLCQICPE